MAKDDRSGLGEPVPQSEEIRLTGPALFDRWLALEQAGLLEVPRAVWPEAEAGALDRDAIFEALDIGSREAYQSRWNHCYAQFLYLDTGDDDSGRFFSPWPTWSARSRPTSTVGSGRPWKP